MSDNATMSNSINVMDDRMLLGRLTRRHHFNRALAMFALVLIPLAWIEPVQLPSPACDQVDVDHPGFGNGSHQHEAGPSRNNSHPDGEPILEWDVDTGRHIKWTAPIGSVTYPAPVVADGKVFIGTNNERGYLDRFPSHQDHGVLLCLGASNGEFLWQYTSHKLGNRDVDSPLAGICSQPVVEDDRLWIVNNRGDVVCLSTTSDTDEAEVLWTFRTHAELGSHQHSIACCSPAVWGNALFFQTSNGVASDHRTLPAPDAPSFVALDKNSGDVLWTDNSPGADILHGQWSSPAVGEVDGIPQVVFAGGDGWVYAFRADRWNADQTPILLWKFDGNPKDSVWELGGRGTRNNIMATPVLHGERVYVAMGQDPEHGDGPGLLWCIDPTGRGDISPEIVVDDSGEPVPKRREAALADATDMVVSNPNSGVVWEYSQRDLNDDGHLDEQRESLQRTLSSPVIVDELLIIPDLDGHVHCLDASSGEVHWVATLRTQFWGSPLAIGDQVYLADEDGEVWIIEASPDRRVALERQKVGRREYDMPKSHMSHDSGIYSTPTFANGVLYIADRQTLTAIEIDQPR